MKRFLTKMLLGTAFGALILGAITLSPFSTDKGVGEDNVIYDKDVVADIAKPHFRVDDGDDEVPDVKKVILTTNGVNQIKKFKLIKEQQNINIYAYVTTNFGDIELNEVIRS